MKRAFIQIRRDQDAKAALAAMGETFVKAWHSGTASDPIATFTCSSPAQLFSVFSPKRWELIEHLQKIGPHSGRGLARSLAQDVKRVHEDVTGLIERGIVVRTEDSKVPHPLRCDTGRFRSAGRCVIDPNLAVRHHDRA